MGLPQFPTLLTGISSHRASKIVRRVACGLVVTFAVTIFMLSWKPHFPHHWTDLRGKVISQIASKNATLGFERIVVVSAGPSWRIDGLLEAADRTGLTVNVPRQPEWSQRDLDAFRQLKHEESTNLAHRNQEDQGIGPGQAQCWLGHLNALKTVIQGGWATALIMEDDVDWDVNIKDQMHLVAPMIKAVTRANNGARSPYGDSWDLLWLGHCGDKVDYRMSNKLAATVEMTLSESTLYRGVYGDYSYFPPQIRMVHPSNWPVCTFSYAVTSGAASKIYGLSKGGKKQIITVELRKLCLGGVLRCVTVNPELFHHQKMAGQVASQIAVAEGWDDLAAPPKIGYTANIRYSARCNAKSASLITCQSEFGDDVAGEGNKTH